MLEILFIFVQLLVFLFLSYFPCNSITSPKSITSIIKSNYDYFFINLIILTFVLLLFSFLKIQLSLIFFLLILIYLLIYLIFVKKITNEIIKKKILILNFFFCIINFCLFINVAYNFELGWDGLNLWIVKTNIFYNGFNYFESFQQLDYAKNYPHLGSYLWAFFWKNSLGNYEYFGRLFYLYLYILSLFVLIGSIQNINIKTKIILILIIFLFSFDYSLGGYQEYLIFSLLVFAAKLLMIVRSNNKSIFFDFILFINTIVLCFIKNECTFYAVFLWLIYSLIKKNKIYSLLFIILILMTIFLQFYFVKIIYTANSFFQISIDPIVWLKNLNALEIIKRSFYTTFYIMHSLLKYPICLINFLAILLSIYFYKKIPENRFLFIFLILNLLFIFAIYQVTPLPIIWHLQTSIKRLFLQTSGFYFFFAINLFNHKVVKIS
jgi:hypothetical protein